MREDKAKGMKIYLKFLDSKKFPTMEVYFVEEIPPEELGTFKRWDTKFQSLAPTCDLLRKEKTFLGQRKVLGNPQYKKQKWICSS